MRSLSHITLHHSKKLLGLSRGKLRAGWSGSFSSERWGTPRRNPMDGPSWRAKHPSNDHQSLTSVSGIHAEINHLEGNAQSAPLKFGNTDTQQWRSSKLQRTVILADQAVRSEFRPKTDSDVWKCPARHSGRSLPVWCWWMFVRLEKATSKSHTVAAVQCHFIWGAIGPHDLQLDIRWFEPKELILCYRKVPLTSRLYGPDRKTCSRWVTKTVSPRWHLPIFVILSSWNGWRMLFSCARPLPSALRPVQ